MDLRCCMTLLIALTSLAASGCAGRSPLSYFASRPPATRTANSTPDRISLNSQGLGQPRPAEDVSAFKTVTGKVSDALTIHPKVIRAEDPISLASHPKSIDPKMFNLMAQALESQGQFDKAEQQYRKALEIDPGNHMTLVGLGRLFDRQGKFDQAVAYYRQAIATQPEDAGGYNDLGLCLARKGDVYGAIAALREAVRLDSRKVLYRNNLAAMLVESGREDEAIQHLKAVHKPAIAHYNLGFLLYTRNEHAAARRQFQLAVDNDPQLSPARHMLDKMAAPSVSSSPQFQIGEETPTPPPSSNRVPAVGEAVLRLPTASLTPVSTREADAPVPTDFNYGQTPQPLPRIE